VTHAATRRDRRFGARAAAAQRLLDDERARILQPLQAAFAHLRQGIGTDADWAQVSRSVHLAHTIERQGAVHGLDGHLRAAELTLQTMHRRAEEDADSRYPYAMHLAEIEVLHTAVDLHALQLSRLSRAEYDRAKADALAAPAPRAPSLLPQLQTVLAL
jgi:hypothetical protein